MADGSDFLEKLKRRLDETGGREGIEPEKEKAEWLDDLDRLYSKIEKWLRPALDQGLLTSERVMGPVEEDLLGLYEAPTLKIRIASGEEVRLLPLRLVIGYRGRVKMECWERYRYLFRKDEGWVIAWSLTPREEEDLDQDSFQRALEDVLPDLP